MSAAEKLLSRLERVRRTGPGRWVASCPTREDRSPSLAVRELDDGRILLHDFGGDDVESILAAVGLSFTDLYPEKQIGFARPVARPFNASDVLSLVAFESTAAFLVCCDVLNGVPIDDEDFERLAVAAQRLGHAAEVCNGSR